MSEIKQRLLPCPFCGGEARLESNGQYAVVGCVNSNCQGYACCYKYDSKKEAIEHWNTRKPMERILTRFEECEKNCRQYKYMTDFQAQANAYLKAQEIIKEEGGIE